jgi:hypothetical protein
MMPSVKEVPTGLRTMTFHGLQLNGRGMQANADCPFCGREGKLAVNVESGLWDCKVCLARGNPVEFLRQLWKVSEDSTSDASLAKLSIDRKVRAVSLQAWGIRTSAISGESLVPAFDAAGKVHNLYRHVPFKAKEGKWTSKSLPTPGVHPEGRAHGIHGVPDSFRDLRPTIHVCEGWSDGVAWWEALQGTALKDQVSVLAVPGAGVFRGCWLSMFTGRKVVLLYDNDDAGLKGMQRAADILLTNKENPPSEVRYLSWEKGRAAG